MRTKHIFSTLMLAALAAACSNEELELVNNSNELAKGRYEIGQIELALGDGVDSRYAVGPNFNDLTAEVGDELGAALIDTWTPAGENGKEHANDHKYDYTISDYIHTNYSFKYNGEKWASEAKMVEGNYFFYAPYNAAHVTRSAVTAKFNPVQQLAVKADGSIDELSTIKQLKESGEVMAVGYKFISREDGKTVSTSLLPIYAYPLVTFKNSYEAEVNGSTETVPTDLVINQIVITKEYGFSNEATFKFAEASKNAITATSGVVAELRDFTYWENDDNPAKEKKGDFAKNNGAEDNFTADLLNDATKTTSAIIVKTPANYTLKAGKTMKFHVVMPAGDYTDGNELKVQVYTNKGVFETNMAFAVAAGKRYAQDEYNEDGTLKNDSEAPAGATINFDMTECEESSGATIVASAADLVTLIQNFKKDGENNTLQVQPLNSDVEINAAVMNAIKAKTAGFTLDVQTPATISTNLDSSNKNITFQEGAVVKEGTVKINGNVTFNGDLTVEGGAVTVDAVFDEAKLVVEDGEVTLNTAAEATVKDGKLTIGAEAATGRITNDGGEVTFVAVDKDHVRTYTNAVDNKKGNVTVPEFTVLKGGINNGSMNGAADAKTIVEGEAMNDNSLNGAGMTFEVSGKAKLKRNRGKVTISSSDAELTLTDNNTGSVDNTKDGKLKVGTEQNGMKINEGEIYYEFTSDVNGDLIPEATTYNAVKLTNMTWKPTDSSNILSDKKLILNKATVSCYVTGKTIIVSNLYVEDSSSIKGAAGAELTVTNGITGKDGKKLTVTGMTVTANGQSVTGEIEF